MEWVETTGRSVDEAKDAALDSLGVDEADAEFEVVDEAKSGLFGRLRQEARVRARVRPTAPPPKLDRRDRKRRGSGGTSSSGSAPAAPAAAASGSGGQGGGRSRGSRSGQGSGGDGPAPRQQQPEGDERSRTGGRPVSGATQGRGGPGGGRGFTVDPDEVLSPAAAGEVTSTFLSGLLGAFGATGETSVEEIDEGTVEVRVTGDDLGLLVGPKGATLSAVQELSRTVLSRSDTDGRGVRLHVDVAGYRARRREALERFTEGVATQVLDSGEPAALEPMNAADRKVVHDTANGIDGVRTTSEGEEPRRRVVLHPDDEAAPEGDTGD